MQWYYNSNIAKTDEGVVAVMQIQGSEDLLAAGFRKHVGGWNREEIKTDEKTMQQAVRSQVLSGRPFSGFGGL